MGRHRVGGLATHLSDVVECADVGIVERGYALRLSREPLAELSISSERRGQNLDRDDAIEARVASAIHFAHASGTEGAEYLVGSEEGPGSGDFRIEPD